jgi:PilZ domain
LVIAVNPNRIELYESLLFFRRLQAQVVDNYDFANGAPAIGATLDLSDAPEIFRQAYAGRRARKNLHRYFTQTPLPHIRLPERRYFTTNDPVMSPELLDHFFNRRTQVFAQLDERKRHLLRAIYHEDLYRDVLPPLATPANGAEHDGLALRRHRRHSMKCPARLLATAGASAEVDLDVIDISLNGFLAHASAKLALGAQAPAEIHLGTALVSRSPITVVRRVRSEGGWFYGFRIEAPDATWLRCINDLEAQENPAGVKRSLTHFDDPSVAWPAYDTVPA